MPPPPWLSVVMPTYNGEAFVAEALESVAVQVAAEQVEVIVVDDGSEDRTLEIVRRYASRLPLTVVAEKHSGNWIRRTNQGMALARGEFVTWLHQDDMWLSGRLAELERLAAEHPDAGFLFHAALFLDRQGRCVGEWSCPLEEKENSAPTAEDVLRHLVVQSFLAASVPAFRRALIERVGFVDERLWFCGDWDYWLRLVPCGDVAYSPLPLCGFRLHPNSLTSTVPERLGNVREQYAHVFAKHQKTRDRFGPRISRELASLARGSATINIALARLARGDFGGLFSLAPAAWELKHRFWRYWQSSRLWERVSSRWRAGCHDWWWGSNGQEGRVCGGPVRLPSLIDGGGRSIDPVEEALYC